MRCGTFNVRGIIEDEDRKILVNDAQKYRLEILVVPETHVTGILVKKSLKPKFERINGGICTALIQRNHCKLLLISIYAHTHEKSEKTPELREDFYEALDSVISRVPKRDEIVLTGDFNAKKGSGYHDFKDNMGKFDKGQINSSGRILLEKCRKNDLVITNTLFQHKISHRSTWIAPIRNFITSNGEERKNPIRNKIDYVIVRNKSRRFINDSRSYGEAETDSDHKFVKIEWTKLEKQQKAAACIDIHGFMDKEKQAKYKELIEAETIPYSENNQERWQNVCKNTKEKAKEAMGLRSKGKQTNDLQIELMAKEKYKIQKDIEACTDQQLRKEKLQRKKILKRDIKARIKEVKTMRVESRLAEIEKMKNDSTRYFTAPKELKSKKQKKGIIVKDKNRKTVVTEKEQIEVVTGYFKQMLAPETSSDNIIQYQPAEMQIPFSGQEIETAAKKLNNGKSLGPDEINLEMIKYAPMSIFTEIAGIYNTVAKEGDTVSELKLGLLRPLQKPGKATTGKPAANNTVIRYKKNIDNMLN